MHFQNSSVLTGRAFNYFLRYKSACKVLHCSVGFDIRANIHESYMGTEACFYF